MRVLLRRRRAPREACLSWGRCALVHQPENASIIGAEAEPDDSGGTSVFLSPGLSYAPTKGFNLYGFFQVPVYVNGVQLTVRRAFTIGANLRF